MGILTSLKNIFLPDEKTSAERRIATFGSDSKLKAGAAIVGGAALAIAAPVLVGSAAVRSTGAAIISKAPSVVGNALSNVAKSVGSAFVNNPVKATAAVVIGAPMVGGAIAKEPSLLIDTPKNAWNFGGNVASYVKENPEKSAILGGFGLLTGMGVAYAVDKTINKSKDSVVFLKNELDTRKKDIPIIPNIPTDVFKKKKEDDAVLPTDTKVPPSNQLIPDKNAPKAPEQPITPQTQPIGIPADNLKKSSTKKRKVKPSRPASITFNVVNANQSRITGRNANYLNKL